MSEVQELSNQANEQSLDAHLSEVTPTQTDKPKHQLSGQWHDAYEVKLGIPPTKPWIELSKTDRAKVIAELDKRLKELEKADKAASRKQRMDSVDKMLSEPTLSREAESFVNRVIACLPHEYEYDRATQKVTHVEWREIQGGEGYIVKTPLCSALAITAITYSEDGREGGLLVEWLTRGGNVAKWCYPQSVLASGFKVLAESLQRQRIPYLTHDDKGKRLFMELLQRSEPSKQMLHTERTGWTPSGSFVFHDHVIGDEEVIFQAMNAHQQPPLIKGDVKDWNKNVGKLCINNPTLILGAGVGLSSSLLGLLGASGVTFHLIGKSSTGKTLSIGVCSTVTGFSKGSWNTTDNSVESYFEALNHIGATLDELHQSSVKSAALITYLLGNGRGKGRANKDGSAQRIRTFALNALSTGELSLDDHLAKGGVTVSGGQSVRFIQGQSDIFKYRCFDDIHDFKDAGEFAKHLEHITGVGGDTFTPSYSGAVGTAFIEYLSKSFAGNTKKLAEVTKRIANHAKALTPVDADSQVSRMATSIALVIVALEMAIKANIIEWDIKHPFEQIGRWWTECVLPTRGGSKSTEEEKALEAIADFLDLKGHLHFAQLGIGDAEKPMELQREQYGYVETVQGITTYYVTGAGFKKMCVGFNPKATAKALYEAGILNSSEAKLEKNGTYQRSKSIMGKVKDYYWLRFQNTNENDV